MTITDSRFFNSPAISSRQSNCRRPWTTAAVAPESTSIEHMSAAGVELLSGTATPPANRQPR